MLKYKIHNHKKLLSELVAENYEKQIEEHTANLKKLFKRYSKIASLEVILSEDGGKYNVTLEINLKSGPRVVKRRGDEVDQITRDAFATLKREIISTLQKERRQHLRKRKQRQARQLVELEKHLDESYQQSDNLTFEQLFKAGIPGLKGYVNRRLHQAVHLGMDESAITADEVINDLYLRVYNKFSNHPKQDEQLLAWVYKEADQLLEEKLKEKDILEADIDYDTLKNREIRSLQEHYAVDAEGELTPLDEFDDPGYLHNLYDLQDIFNDNPDEAHRIKNELDLMINREELHERILEELSRQPFFNRGVFDLFVLEKFGEEEIAEIKSCSVRDVEDALRNTRTFLKERIRSWTAPAEEEAG